MTSYTIGDGDGGAALDENQQQYRGDGVGVIDPGGGDLKVSVDTGALGGTDTLSVASGDAYIQGTTYTISSQSISIDGANGTDPRRDVVYVNTSGSVEVINGTPEARDPENENLSRFEYFRPAPAALNGTVACVLAEVWVPAGATSVTSSDLRDRRVRALQADSVAEDLTTETELNNHIGNADAHHTDPTAGSGITDAGDNQFALDTVTSKTVTLSSGSAVVSTGLGAGESVDVYLDPSGGGSNSADVKAAARAFWDNSTGEIKIEIIEDGTSVDNPNIGIQVVKY